MLTITYRGPTNTRGARMVCKGHQGQVTLAWDYAGSARDNAHAAVRAYLAKHDDEGVARGTWVVAEDDASGWVAVRVGAMGDQHVAVAPWDVDVQVRS